MQNPVRPTAGTTADIVISDAFSALGIDVNHSLDAEAEATDWQHADGIDDVELIDLTALPFVTIDNPDSRDLDQAVYIERDTGNSGFRVRYALADASYYVTPGTALYSEALARGSSHYAPDRVAPMLPRGLSEDLVSLEANTDRRALVFDMQLDNQAKVLHTRIVRARIHSRAQLSYRGVQAWLDGKAREDEPIDPRWHGSLSLLRDVGRQLQARARERGVISFDRREADISIGTSGRFEVAEGSRHAIEEWNAEVSLLCNREGARLLAVYDRADGADGGLEPVYRVHDAPLSSRLKELRKQLDIWAAESGAGNRWRWAKEKSLADFLHDLPGRNDADKRRVRAVQRQVLVRQRASEFRAEPGRHHALAVEGYARFSSPMREIVGIYTHAELLGALLGTGLRDPDLQHMVIESANAAKRRQKALDKRIGFAVIADLLESDLGRESPPSHQGTVLGIRSGNREHDGFLYIGIDAFALDLKVYADDLRRRFGTGYRFDALAATPEVTAPEPAAQEPVAQELTTPELTTQDAATQEQAEQERSARAPAFMLGDAVDLRAVGFDDGRQRYQLDIKPRGEAARRERQNARRV